MPTLQPARRRTSALALAASLAMLAAALVAPSQTIARTRSQAHKPTCPTSSGHAKAKRTGHTCTRPSHKGKHHAKHHAAGKHQQATVPAPSALPPASCEDGSAPVRAASGDFSCKDGSEPECEDGSTPAPSSKGTRLLCPAASEQESESGESECEEDLASICSADSSLAASEHACQASPGGGSSFVCEDEDER